LSELADQIISLVRNPTDDRLHEFEGEHGFILGGPMLFDSRFLVEYAQSLLEEVAEILSDKCDGLVLDYSVVRGVAHIACLDLSSRVRVKRNHRFCFELLRALNAMLVDKYEIRSMTYRKDEPGFRTFVLADCGAWAEAERSEDLSSQFQKIGPSSGFAVDRFPRLALLWLQRLGGPLVRLLGTIMVRRALRR
jgi:hypothetical protein